MRLDHDSERDAIRRQDLLEAREELLEPPRDDQHDPAEELPEAREEEAEVRLQSNPHVAVLIPSDCSAPAWPG